MNPSIFCLILICLSSFVLDAQDYERYKKLSDTTLTSVHLAYDKNISVTVPIEWQENIARTFPLIIVFDSQNERSHQYMLNTIDYLTSNEQMPAAVVISVESTQEFRYSETLHKASGDNGRAAENENFLFDELIPLAETKYKASPFRLFIGHSRYGYFTTSLLCSRIHELSGVISISPFFGQENVNLLDSIAQLETKELKFTKYYRFGMGNDFPGDYAKMDSVLQKLDHPMLDAKGVLFRDADHNVTPGLTIGTALYEIFEDWSEMQSAYISNSQTDLSIIDSLEKEIGKKYGSELVFSLGVLNGKGWFFYNENEFEKAIEAWNLLLKTYPNFSEAYLYIIDAEQQLNRDYGETINRFKFSLTESEFYSEEEKEELRKELENISK